MEGVNVLLTQPILNLFPRNFSFSLLFDCSCTQHLNHRNSRVDFGRDKCWTVFSPSQNSEFWTITWPLQQAKTTRMRLKMRSNTREGEDGQQPITSDYCKGQHLTDFSSCCTHLYSYSCIWLRVGTRKWNSCSILSQSILMSPRNLKRPPIGPQLISENTSEWRAFNLSSIDPGSSQNFSRTEVISFEGILLATRR